MRLPHPLVAFSIQGLPVRSPVRSRGAVVAARGARVGLVLEAVGADSVDRPVDDDVAALRVGVDGLRTARATGRSPGVTGAWIVAVCACRSRAAGRRQCRGGAHRGRCRGRGVAQRAGLRLRLAGRCLLGLGGGRVARLGRAFVQDGQHAGDLTAGGGRADDGDADRGGLAADRGGAASERGGAGAAEAQPGQQRLCRAVRADRRRRQAIGERVPGGRERVDAAPAGWCGSARAASAGARATAPSSPRSRRRETAPPGSDRACCGELGSSLPRRASRR